MRRRTGRVEARRYGPSGARRSVRIPVVVGVVGALAVAAATVAMADPPRSVSTAPVGATAPAGTTVPAWAGHGASAAGVAGSTRTTRRRPTRTSSSASSSASSSGTTTSAVTSTTSSASGAAATVTYPASDAQVANPERGFTRFDRCDQGTLDESWVRGYRTSGRNTLLQCVFYLEKYRQKDLDQTVLAHFDEQMAVIRRAGVKTSLRFAYTEDTRGDDATPAQVLRHIAQLASHLRGNADVIATLQAGFVGTWGEWYYTQHFGNDGQLTDTDRANRRAVVQALLDAIGSRPVQVRTPAFKQMIYGTGSLGAAQALASTADQARVGFHNDCFLASADDEGTYRDPTAEKAYLGRETTYVVMGGETCLVNPPRTDCPTALQELASLHFSYLNLDYNESVIAGWQKQGCLDTIQKRLGYRLVLQDGTYPDAVRRSDGLPIRITMRNDGWAAPISSRPVQLVLRSGSTVRRITLSGVNPRTWAPGEATRIEATVPLPTDLPAGSYQLALALPDAADGLAGRPEYAIQTANSGLWDATNGWNDLRRTVTVS